MSWMWIAICVTFGMLVHVLEFSVSSWQFWCIYGLIFSAYICGTLKGKNDVLDALEQELKNKG